MKRSGRSSEDIQVSPALAQCECALMAPGCFQHVPEEVTYKGINYALNTLVCPHRLFGGYS